MNLSHSVRRNWLFILNKFISVIVAAVVILSLAQPKSRASAAVNLTVEPITWNVVGLDSNNVTVGPNNFPIGVRVCNSGTTDATNVTSSFVWDSYDPYINLRPGSITSFTGPYAIDTLAAGNCADFHNYLDLYYEVQITRTSAAYDHKRSYHITASSNETGAVSSPTPREIYVEHLVSQNRNSISRILLNGSPIATGGTMNLAVGGTYEITLEGATSTNGYNQIESFINFPNTIFQVKSVETTYTVSDIGSPIYQLYGDGCTWDSDPSSPTYRSCTGVGKAGGVVTAKYTITVIAGAGTSQILNSLLYDFSGSSYHYNSDFSAYWVIAKIISPASINITKSFTPGQTTVGGVSTLSFTLTNPTSTAINGASFSDTFPTSPGNMIVASPPAASTSGCGTPTFAPTAGAGSISFSNGTIAANSTCTIKVNVIVPAEGTYDNTTGTLKYTEPDPVTGTRTVDTGNTASASLTASAAPPPPACTPNQTMVTWIMDPTQSTTPPPVYWTKAANVASAVTAEGTSPLVPRIDATTGNPKNSWAGYGWQTSVALSLPSTSYFEFQVDTTNYSSIVLTFDARRQNNGPKNFDLYVKVGSSGTETYKSTYNPTTSFVNYNASFPTAGETNTNGVTYFRLYGYDATNQNAGADLFLDNITFTGCSATLPPNISKTFTTNPVPVNGTSVLTFTLSNPNVIALNDVQFDDTLPAGLVVNSPATGASTTCTSATFNPTAGGSSLSLTGASIPAGGSCTATVTIKATTAGPHNNISGYVTSSNGGTNTGPNGIATATLTALQPPNITKSFAPSPIIAGSTSTLTFTITNPNLNDPISGVGFSDTFPTSPGNMVVATPNGASTSGCGTPTYNPSPGAGSISFSGGTIAAGGVCTVKVDVTAPTAGHYNNTSGAVSSTDTGAGNTASASLDVNALTPGLRLLKQISTDAGGPWYSYITVNGGSDLYYQFTVENTGNVQLGSITLNDTDVPLGSCSLTSPLAVGAETSCIIGPLTAESALGTYTNTATVTGSYGGNTYSSLPSSASYALPAPDLSVTKTNDVAGSVLLGTPFKWKLTIRNNRYGQAATFNNGDLILRDDLPAGPTYGTVSQVSGSIGPTGTIDCSIAGAQLTCTASGTVTFPAGASLDVSLSVSPASAGDLVNPANSGACQVDPNNVVAENNEANNTASDTVAVNAPASPDLRVAKSNNTAGAGSVGTTFIWNLTVSNTGTADAVFASTQTIISDPLPAGATYSYSGVGGFTNITNSGNISCAINTGTLACTASGGSVTVGTNGSFTVSFSVTPTTNGNLVNTAQVDPSNGITEGNESNNTGSNTVAVAAPVTLNMRNTWVNAFVNDAVDVSALFGGSPIQTLSSIANTANETDTAATPVTVTVGQHITFDDAFTSGKASNYTTTLSCSGAADTDLSDGLTVNASDTAIVCTYTHTRILPDLELAKANNTGGAGTVGTPYTWTLTASNSATAGDAVFANGDVILKDNLPSGPSYGSVAVTNGATPPSGPFSCAIASDTLTCTATGTVTLAAGASFDAAFTVTPNAAGSLVNPASGGTNVCQVDPNNAISESNEANNTATDTVTVTAAASPSLTIAKTITSTGPYDSVGDTITYSFTVTNSGNVTLSGPFTVTDDKASDESCPATATLAPGDSITCTASYDITLADLNASSVTNVASAHAVYGVNPVDSPTDTKTATLTQSPALTIVKSVTETGFSAVGDVLHYSYIVTNSGNVTLSGPFTVTDDKATDESCPVTATLDPGNSITCTATYTVTLTDLNAGSITNVASAHASFGGSAVDSLTDTKTVNASQNPALTIAKSVTETGFSAVGDVLHYTYLVTNSGNVTLSGPFTVTDDKATDETCPVTATLDPGNSITCTATYTINLSDLNAGSVTNIASAHAAFGATTVDSPTDTKTVTGTQNPALTIAKSVTETGFSAVGDLLHYSYLVTNSGNVTLSGPFTVTDDKATDEACPVTAALAPGDTIPCTATYTITLADLNAGSVTNVASAHASFGGSAVDSLTDTKTVTGSQNPALTIAKSVTEAGYSTVGDVLHYSYLVTNSGNVTLSGPFTVTDDKAADEACPVTATLAPGNSITCTATYTITLTDLNAGSITNVASAHGSFGGSAVDSPTDTRTVNATQNPALAIAKSVTEISFSAVGDVLHYSYLVTNSGNVTLSGPFTVTDDKSTDEFCPVTGSLTPGGSITCTATYTIILADLDAGSVTNVASAHASFGGTAVDSSTDTKTVAAGPNPALTIVKSITSSGPYDSVGDTISYGYVVTNSGNVTLSGPFTVTDDKATDESCPATVTLAPGDSITCSASYDITLIDLDAGSVTNIASAHAVYSGNPVDSPTDSQTANLTQSPALTIIKSISSTGPYDSVGDTITYSYTVTNSGNVTVNGPFTVTDDKASNESCPATATLAPGSSITCTASYDITLADLNSGSVTNVASAHAVYGGNPVDSPTDTKTATLIQSPALSIVKNVTETGYSAVGDVLHYSYSVTNSGNVTLSEPFTVTDDKATDESCPVTATLDPGSSIICTATYSITLTDLNTGSVTNVASAHAFFGGSTIDSPTDTKTVNASQNPALTIAKSVTEAGFSAVGDVLHYSYLVTNSGNVTLSGPFTVTDDKATDEACPVTATLAPGASITCTATYTIKLTDLNAGSVTNVASAHGSFGATTVDSTTDTKTVSGSQNPALTIVKSVIETGFSTVGDVLHYSYLVTNSGNVTLSGPFTVTDDKATDETCPATVTLDPGSSITCAATYTITLTDLNSGSVTNVATAHGSFGGTTVDSSTDTKTVNGSQNPALTIVKSVTETGYSAAGDVLHYSYLVTNSGNVTLSGPFTITDDKATDEACPATATLAPGGSITCTATYAITLVDMNAGSVTNIASAHGSFGGSAVDSSTDTKTVNATQNPALTIVKNVTETSFTTAGDVLHYSYLVTNSGNVTLTGPFTVTDDKAADEVCPAAATLAPGNSITCTATYTVTLADLNTGSVTNVASAHGLFGGSAVDSLTDTKTINAAQNPALTIVKSVTETGFSAVGDVLHYSYLVTNSGNVSLDGPFTVTDDQATDEACPATATLAPGSSITCTATYTIALTDLDAGSVTNVASAHGSFGGTAIDSPTDTKTVNATQNPALTIVKSVTETGFSAVGDVLHYSYLVTNSGNVTLSGPFTVTDDRATDETCPVTISLAPGGSITCTATYTVTLADLNAGSVTNIASAHGFSGATPVNSASDTKTVNATQTKELTLVKNVTEAGFSAVGNVLHYSYTVTNSGNVTLTGPFTVTDDKANDELCPVTATLAPGDSITCTATYTITLADQDAGSVTNIASAHGYFGATVINSNNDTATVTYQPGSISGKVYFDKDMDMLIDPTEAGIGNVTIEIYDETGMTLIDTLKTGPDGSYSSGVLPPGNYLVVEVDPTGYVSTTPNEVSVTVPINGVTHADFGDFQIRGKNTNSITGTVFNDANSDGNLDELESVIPGVTVTLYDLDGNKVAETTTGPNGKYSFTKLPPGVYTVVETNPDGYASTTLDHVSVVLGSGTKAVVDYGDKMGAATVVDPAVTKYGEPSSAKIGDTVIFTLSVGNNSTTDALDVKVTDEFPTFLDIISITISPDNDFPVTITGNTFTIEFGTVRTTDFYTVTIVTRVNNLGHPPGGVNNVTLETSSPDDPIYNDADSARVVIRSNNGGGGGEGGVGDDSVLPLTGFAPWVVTNLPPQPADTLSQQTGMMLEIRSLGVNASIVGIPQSGDTWDVTWLDNQVGYLDGTAFPTWSGNSVLTAHVYNASGLPGPFINLGNLKWGDQVIIRAFGQLYIYEVRSVTIVSPDDTSAFEHKDQPWLTLVTCKQYDINTGAYRLRTIVQAVQVKVSEETSVDNNR